MAESISADRPPYLTLTISQALSLPPPPAPEPKHHESVNSMLEKRACHMPDQFAVGFTQLASDGTWTCQTLTYAQVRTLSQNLASGAQARLPERETNAKSPSQTPLVAVLSPSGLDLFGHIVALWRLGYGVLCIAPGSPAESIANLLRLTQTKVVLAHATQLQAAEVAAQAAQSGDGDRIEAQVCEMLPNVIDRIDQKPEQNSTTASRTAAGSDDVLVTMHTSGSSGLPKPIYQLHRFWTASMLSAPGRELPAFTTTPLFHGGMSDLLRSIQAGSSIFFHPTADPGALSTSAICQAIAACKVPISYFLSVPYILDMLFAERSDEGRRMLASMQLVSTGGAPLPQQLGDDMVKQGIKLVSRLGSSECGFLMSSWRNFELDKEWNHLRVPDQLGQSMLRFEPHDPTSEGGLFELIVTKDWPTKLVANRDDGGYATSDLYSKQGANTWRYDSRSDDTIVLISGKKATAPVAEQKLKASPLVTEAIAFGANRAILGTLVFISADAVPQGSVLDDRLKINLLKQLQPVLSEINAASPPHAKLASEMICLLPPSEAANIPRASKGTLQRGRAYQHYAELIDSIYLDFEEGRSLRLDPANGNAGVEKEMLSGQQLVQWLQGKVEEINGKSLSPDMDVFVAGVDSIQSARIRAALHQNVDLGGRLLERNVVYEYPTLSLLAEHVEEVRGGSAGDAGKDVRRQRELGLMQELVEKYSAAPSKPTTNGFEAKKQLEAQSGTLYILTGVTGGLGAQTLDQVASHQLQSKDSVLCLVRADDDEHARKRVLESLTSRRLDSTRTLVESSDSPVDCLSADLSRSDCGLTSAQLSSFSSSGYTRVVTIHSAWSVNFVASLSSFEQENIAGLSHLLSLHQSFVASTSSTSPQSCFTFCSSVASILGSQSKTLEETFSTSPADAVSMGYARSKWVAEQIVIRRLSNQAFRIVRIGQLCSDTMHGVWNESEAWPILIRLSCQLGSFPHLTERLDWISTDVAAKSVVDITNSKAQGVHNIAQPTTSSKEAPTWEDLYKWLTASGLNLTLVSPQDWLDKLQKSNADHRGLLALWQRNFTSDPPQPEQQIRFNCDKSLEASNDFRKWQNQGVTRILIQKTVQRWKEIGFLP